MSEPIAMIGARAEKLAKLDPAWVTLYRNLAIRAAWAGREVRTGAATGADQEAAEAALEAGGKVRLYVPWEGFQAQWLHTLRGDWEIITYREQEHAHWKEQVLRHHPAPQALDSRSMRLMCRNVPIVAGEDCASPVACVIAIPLWEGGRAGGTGFGMDLGRALGIPVWDLSQAEAREHWERRLGCT